MTNFIEEIEDIHNLNNIHNLPNIESSDGFLADPMTMYSIDYMFNETFSMSSFHKIVFNEYNLDLDYIYDRCEESRVSFENTLKRISDTLYQSSSPFQKNLIAYKYLHNLGLDIKKLVNKVSDTLNEIQNTSLIDDIDDIGSTNTRGIINRIKNTNRLTLDRYASQNLTSEYMNTTEFKLLRIIDNFLFNHLFIFNKIKGDITESFNNVVKNAYRKRLEKSTRTMNSFLGIRELKKRNNNTYIVSTPTRTSSYIDRIYNSIDNNINSMYGNYGSTNSTSLVYDNNLFDDMMGTYRSQVKLKQKEEKISKKTPGVRIMNKSLKVIRKFFSTSDFSDFLKCIEITVKGELFDYGFKLRNRKDLITYSKRIDNFSINWDLNIYTKLGEKICRSCVTFKGSPILDQVLTAYLLIKTNKEKEILINSGFFDKEYPYFSEILEPLVKSLKEENNKNIEGFNFNLNYDQNNLTVNNDMYSNLRRNRYLINILQQSEIKISINNWIRDYLFTNGFDRTLYEYTTNLDVSFGEAVSYEAFNLFNIDCFNHLVKPLKWKKDLFRFKNKILLDIDEKAEIIKKFTPNIIPTIRGNLGNTLYRQ